MSGYQYILLDMDPKAHIATLTLNRPDRRNALNDVMQEFRDRGAADLLPILPHAAVDLYGPGNRILEPGWGAFGGRLPLALVSYLGLTKVLHL